EKGFIQIVLPTGLLVPINEEAFADYFITLDGKEAHFEQLSPIVIKIPFEKDTKKIEIIGKVWPKPFGKSG
ncbi:MAG: hypothetical protein WD512_02550, partial [Candidatus Paceibacterota bacterium]